MDYQQRAVDEIYKSLEGIKQDSLTLQSMIEGMRREKVRQVDLDFATSLHDRMIETIGRMKLYESLFPDDDNMTEKRKGWEIKACEWREAVKIYHRWLFDQEEDK